MYWVIPAALAGRERAGFLGGCMNLGGNIAGITTPIIIGFIVQATGSYFLALMYFAAAGVLAAWLFFLEHPAWADAAERRFAECPRVADAEPHRLRPVWIEVIGALAHRATIMPCRRQRQNRAALTLKPRRPQAARMPQAQNAR